MQEPFKRRFFYRVTGIAAFLKLPEAKVDKMLEAGELPVKKDTMGRLVLCNRDYDQKIGGKVEEDSGKHGKRQTP